MLASQVVRRALLLVGAFALAPSVAHAEPIRAAVLTIGLKPSGKRADRLRARVRKALEARPDVTLMDQAEEERLFAAMPPDRNTAQLKNARRVLKRAEKALRSFELDKAQLGYARAKDLLEREVGLRHALALDRERLDLGISVAHALRNDDQLNELLREYGVRYGDDPPQSWPPDLVQRLKDATPAATTGLDVRSTPPGAEVFLDGVKAGVTPVALTVRPGDHRIELFKEGHHPADVLVQTTALKRQEVDLPLSPDIGVVLAKQSVTERLDPKVRDRVQALAAEANVDLVILAGARKGRLNLRTLDDEARFEADASAEGARLAVEQLFTARAGPPGSSAVPTWAWVGIGTGAVAVGTGVALRMLAIDAQDDLMSRQGALTQTDAFDRNSDVNVRATSGAVLLGVGSAAITGIAAWLIYDLVASDD